MGTPETKNGDDTQEAVDPRLGAVLGGRYRIERLLGSGGMGSVYRAEHVHMRKPVAVKVLHRELAYLEEVVARFEREAVAAGRIEHPNVAAATDFGRLEDGSFYLVLEYVAGRSLSQLLENGPLELERSLSIGRQIAEALSAAHDAGIVHRDLKPDNIMLVEQPDGSDRVKVLDFGIAKVAEPEGAAGDRALTRIGTVMGTAVYMSPEQAVGQSVDHRTDLYSFGVMLYEMVTGHPPFEAETLTQVLAQKITAPPPPLPEGTPPALQTLVARLLEKTPDDRLQTAAELVDALEQLTAPAAVSGQASARAPLDAEADGDAPTSRVGARIDPTGATVLDAEPPATANPTEPGRSRRWLLLGVSGAVAAGLGSLLLSTTTSENVEAAGGPGPASSAGVAASASAAASATPPRKGADQGPMKRITKQLAEPAPQRSAAPSASSAPQESAKAATPPPSKRSSTTTTSQKTRPKQAAPKRTKKRRTGPGGIYIPPPSEWF